MEKILDLLTVDGEKELEARIILSCAEFRQIYETLKSMDTKREKESYIISALVTSTKKTHRKEIFYTSPGGEKQDEQHCLKAAICNAFLASPWPNKFKLALCTEEPCERFSVSSANRVRMKHRWSTICLKLPLWRFDLTMALEIQPETFYQLRGLKSRMFCNDFNSSAFWTSGSENGYKIRYELEAEFLAPSEFTAGDYDKLVSFLEIIISGRRGENKNPRQLELFELAKMVIPDEFHNKKFSPDTNRPHGLKQLVNQPFSMTREFYLKTILPKIDQYCVTDKTDGERGLAFFRDTDSFVLLADGSSVPFKNNGLNMVVDAEILFSDSMTQQKRKIKRMYIFDLLTLNGVDYTELSFIERLDLLKKIKLPRGIKIKQFHMLSTENYGSVFKTALDFKTPYIKDGLILTPLKVISQKNQDGTQKTRWSKPKGYFDMRVYKWKPPLENTVDLLMVKAPAKCQGLHPYMTLKGHEMYFLFCGIKERTMQMLSYPMLKGYNNMIRGIKVDSRYLPVQFSPPSYPYIYVYHLPIDSEFGQRDLHHCVGEFRFVSTDSLDGLTPELVKLRPDKTADAIAGLSYGNDYKTACDVFDTYIVPLDFATLCSPVIKQYFQKQKQTPEEKRIAKYNLFVKAQVIAQFSPRTRDSHPTVVDLGAGRGQDLFTLNGFRFGTVLCVDSDATALNEAVSRRSNFGKRGWYQFAEAPPTRGPHMRIYTLARNLALHAPDTLNLIHQRYPIEPGFINLVTCHFAMHYWLGPWNDPMTSVSSKIHNLVKLVTGLLHTGGAFVFSCFNGRYVYELLKSPVDACTFSSNPNQVRPKKITRKFPEGIGYTGGLPISVSHSFSNTDYNEYLVDLDEVIKAFTSNGFELQQNRSFGDWRSRFARYNPAMAHDMSTAEHDYVSLYSIVTLIKTG